MSLVRYLYTVLSFVFMISGKAQTLNYNLKAQSDSIYEVRANFRSNHIFFSLFINNQGFAYVIKMYGSFDSTILQINKSDTSNIFKLDSLGALFSLLVKLEKTPQIIRYNTSSMPKAEIYYNNNKVYDSNVWEQTFWRMFQPIMEQVPFKFNPFLVNSFSFNKFNVFNLSSKDNMSLPGTVCKAYAKPVQYKSFL